MAIIHTLCRELEGFFSTNMILSMNPKHENPNIHIHIGVDVVTNSCMEIISPVNNVLFVVYERGEEKRFVSATG